MNTWLFALGAVGITASGVWYGVLLRTWSPGLRVPFLSKGEIPTRSIYLWLLTVLLGESFVVNSFAGERGGFSVLGGVLVAFVLSELARWAHNRAAAVAPAEPPAEWFADPGPGPDRPERPDGS